jgi:hypothetical protein
MEFSIPSNLIGELVNIIVVININSVAGSIKTRSEVTNFIVGVGNLCGTIPAFGEEVVVDIVSKGAGMIVTI